MPNGYTYKVEIEGNAGFILDADLLDTGLLGYVPTDVTQYVRSISVKTGRSTLQDKFTAGQMSIVFDNRARVFDPNYTPSPIYGAVKPRNRVRFAIITDYYPDPGLGIFVGFIDDWSFDYDVSGESTATASCSDAFTVLANQNLTLTTPTAETTDDRFFRALSASSVAWPLELATTQSTAFTMGTASYSGDALSYLQQLADSERGYLAVIDGVVILWGWNWFTPIYDSTFVTFSDSDSTKIPFTNLQTSYDTNQFYNYVTVSGYPGTAVVQDTTSQTNYGISAEEFPVLQSGTAQIGVVANHIINTFAEPRFRVSSLTVSLENQQVQKLTHGVSNVINMYIGTYVGVSWTPNAIGTAVYNDGYIIGIDVTAEPDRCDLTFSISGDDTRTAYP
jgi:hypothetical protein